MAWILDLDGVVWLAESPIPGSPDAIARLRERGERVLFVTNNSFPTVDQYVAKMAGMGIALDPSDLCTSAQAAARLLAPGSRALVCGGPGVLEALSEQGVESVLPPADPAAPVPPVDAVVVGFHRDFDYVRLLHAFRAIRAGARFVATNDDATYPTPDGPIPGGGSIVAAVSYATGVTPEIAGKPGPAIARLVFGRLGDAPGAGPAPELVFVGDRASTDGRMAHALGAEFCLVLSGVTHAADLPVEPSPARVADDLAALVSASERPA